MHRSSCCSILPCLYEVTVIVNTRMVTSVLLGLPSGSQSVLHKDLSLSVLSSVSDGTLAGWQGELTLFLKHLVFFNLKSLSRGIDKTHNLTRD